MQQRATEQSAYQVVDRLLALRDLLRQRPRTRQQITDSLPEYYTDDESGARKIRRDLQYLQRLGYQVLRDKSLKTYDLVVTRIECDWTTEELVALAALRESFKGHAPYAGLIQAIVRRVADGLNDDARQVFSRKPALTIELAVADKQSPAALVWQELEKALLEHQCICFQYHPLGRSDAVKHSDEEPLALEFRDGHYYFTAYSHKTDRVHDYRVDQIVPGSVQILPRHAVADRRRPMIDFQYRLSPRLAARGASVRFPEIVAYEPQADGSLIITARAFNEFWVMREILRYGEQAEVISPPSLRDRMRRVTEQMAAMYRRDDELRSHVA